jgi:hypothetical protein
VLCLGAIAKSARAAGLNTSVAEKYAADAAQTLAGSVIAFSCFLIAFFELLGKLFNEI